MTSSKTDPIETGPGLSAPKPAAAPGGAAAIAPAAIVYDPALGARGVLATAAAVQVLTYPAVDGTQRARALAGLAGRCESWKKRMAAGPGPDSAPLDEIVSGRRRYFVRGCPLERPGSAPRRGAAPAGSRAACLFTLDRGTPEEAAASRRAREWGLSPRERLVVALLSDGLTNKEIGAALGLSVNTVKSYMKFLMRKLGVGTRAGILGPVLTGKPPRPRPPAPGKRS